ncbi:MAG: hypothetical protein IIB83_04595 [Bacteroidetes bacterium]|nr:hypothetical protein [Bacteroidota bacterium]
MVYLREELGKTVSHKVLEAALIKAAEETGLKKRDNGDVSEIGECTCTTFHFKKFPFQDIEIATYNHGCPTDFFRVYSEGIASKKIVERYIERVHDCLKKS